MGRKKKMPFKLNPEWMLKEPLDFEYNKYTLLDYLQKCEILVSCGAAGVRLVNKATWKNTKIKVAVDLNGVPPEGIEGVEPLDKDISKQGVKCYGALGVGSFKMKLHKKCISALFESNQLDLNEDSIFDLSASIGET